jgi:hypothetical protein
MGSGPASLALRDLRMPDGNFSVLFASANNAAVGHFAFVSSTGAEMGFPEGSVARVVKYFFG